MRTNGEEIDVPRLAPVIKTVVLSDMVVITWSLVNGYLLVKYEVEDGG